MFVFSNLAISIDGKIATGSREFFPLGTPADREQMQVLRRESDCILMGASTLRTFQKPLLAEGAAKQPLNVILSSKLDGIKPSWAFFTSNKIKRLIFVSAKCSRAKIAQFKKNSEVVILKNSTPKNPTAKQIIDALEERGCKRLLVEGGGALMWDFSSQDLIDEYHVTVTPRVLGGTEAPTLIDGIGLKPDEVVNLKLEQCRVLKNELYLVYRKTGKRGRKLPVES